MKFSTLFLAVSLFAFSPKMAKSAPQQFTTLQAQAMAKIVKVKRQKLIAKLKMRSTPLVRFFLGSAAPKQGEKVTIFSQMDTTVVDHETILLGALDGVSMPLEHSAKNLWIADIGPLSEIRSYEFKASIFIQSEFDAEQLRLAITQLESQVASLNDQIENSTDPDVIADLTAQRDEKVSQKNILVQALFDLKKPIGDQVFTFNISENTNNPDFPHVASVSPNVVKINTAGNVVITGSNFGANPSLVLGGEALSVTSASPTSIEAAVPPFATQGIKDLEVRFSEGSQVKNAFLKNAFFVTESDVGGPGGDHKPVAVASVSNTEIALGDNANFVSTGSYDPENAPIRYEWRLISKPSGSSFVIPTNPAETDPSFSIMPDVPGSYVAELKVFEQFGQQQASASSLAVVNVVSQNHLPTVFAEPIVALLGQTVNVQLQLTDQDTWQSHSYVVSQQANIGNASVSDTGLLTFTGTSFGEADMFIRVIDNGEPPLYSDFLLHVSVIDQNVAPSASAPPIEVGAGGQKSSQITVIDPNLSQTHTFAVTTPPVNGTATVSQGGLVTYFAAPSYLGADSIEVSVTDNGTPMLSTMVSIPVSVVGNLPPVIGTLEYAILSKGVPVNVVLNTDSNLSDPDGTIAYSLWTFGDGTQEKTFDPTGAIFHNYMVVGTYTASVKVFDNLGGFTAQSFSVNVVDTDIPTVKFTGDTFAGSSPLTVNFDASAATDSDGISQYWWSWTGGNETSQFEKVTAPMISHTFTQSGVYEVKLFTIDPNNALSTSSVFVFVDVAPPLPFHPATADFSTLPSREQLVGSAFNFDGARSFNPNAGGTVASYEWNFGDWASNCGNGCNGTGIIASHQYDFAGTWYPSLTVAGPDGVQFRPAYQEIFVVNAGHAPRAVAYADVLQGAAPLNVHFASESYDFDGTLTLEQWGFGDQNCVGPCQGAAEGQQVSHTFTQPGVYFVSHSVTDNDANQASNFLTITVDPAKVAKTKKTRTPPPYDNARERQRQMLTNACAKGKGDACFFLSKMYAEDGSAYTALKLKEKSCALGHQAACNK